ncbi:hypothetical protein FHS96_000080 [Sphingomonas zeicaulis]|uniref:hypothetical protein n=1 Tax=Sphingomonas zeicaulis TaxID=1632740 RepID=UPI003D1D2E5E
MLKTRPPAGAAPAMNPRMEARARALLFAMSGTATVRQLRAEGFGVSVDAIRRLRREMVADGSARRLGARADGPPVEDEADDEEEHPARWAEQGSRLLLRRMLETGQHALAARAAFEAACGAAGLDPAITGAGGAR